MKLIAYTEYFNHTEKEAKVKGYTHLIKALHIETQTWYSLYYRNEETALKERERMERLTTFKKITGPKPL